MKELKEMKEDWRGHRVQMWEKGGLGTREEGAAWSNKRGGEEWRLPCETFSRCTAGAFWWEKVRCRRSS